VDRLVVGEGQHEALGEGVDEAEGQLVVVIAAMNRVLGEVLEGVVHPAHVPFEPEAEATEGGRPRDAVPRRGLLGHRDGTRMLGPEDPFWKRRSQMCHERNAAEGQLNQGE